MDMDKWKWINSILNPPILTQANQFPNPGGFPCVFAAAVGY